MIKNDIKVVDEGPILMVDDNDLDLYIAKTCFEKSNLQHELVGFRSGREFLNYMKEVLESDRSMPVLVLLDINMPEMNGFEVLAEIRKQKEFQKIPVITMLTNSDNPKDIETATALGADGYNVKPLLTEEYVDFFNSMCP